MQGGALRSSVTRCQRPTSSARQLAIVVAQGSCPATERPASNAVLRQLQQRRGWESPKAMQGGALRSSVTRCQRPTSSARQLAIVVAQGSCPATERPASNAVLRQLQQRRGRESPKAMQGGALRSSVTRCQRPTSSARQLAVVVAQGSCPAPNDRRQMQCRPGGLRYDNCNNVAAGNRQRQCRAEPCAPASHAVRDRPRPLDSLQSS